ncbi:hypothetical protein LXL04_035248 [Taraxacum kok-saghyz]
MTMSIVDHELPYDTHNLYDVRFFEDTISTIVTNTPSYVDTWISDVERIHRSRLHSLVVGLDVEWRPNQSRNFENPVATLQLCVGRSCLIFQILHSPMVPQSLRNFFSNPSYTFVGVGIDNDLEKLTEDHNLVAAKTADLRALAAEMYGLRELKNSGIKDLTRRVLGKEMNKPKGITMSRWDNQWLSSAQVQYACIDAFLSFEIGRILIIIVVVFSDLLLFALNPYDHPKRRQPRASTEPIDMTKSMSIVNHGPNDGTNNLYDVNFFEETILTLVTSTPSYVDMWITDIERLHRHSLSSLIVGLDVEWRPNYCRDCKNPVATLQLCVGRSCLIFQILHSPIIPWSLCNFLRNPSYTFSGVGIDEDVKKLTEDYYLVVANTVDLRLIAAAKYRVKQLKNAGLKELTRRVIGKNMSKPKAVTMSSWDNQRLTPAQVMYACIDAFVSFEIGRILILGNRN